MTPSNLNYNAPQDSPDRKGIAEAQKQSRPSNTELREALKSIDFDWPVQLANSVLTIHFLPPHAIDKLLSLFQAREQKLLTELLSHKSVITLSIYGTNNCEALEIIPVSAIERLQNKTNDGGRNGEN